MFRRNLPPLLNIASVLHVTRNTQLRFSGCLCVLGGLGSMAESAVLILKGHLSKVKYTGYLNSIKEVERLLAACYPSLERSSRRQAATRGWRGMRQCHRAPGELCRSLEASTAFVLTRRHLHVHLPSPSEVVCNRNLAQFSADPSDRGYGIPGLHAGLLWVHTLSCCTRLPGTVRGVCKVPVKESARVQRESLLQQIPTYSTTS